MHNEEAWSIEDAIRLSEGLVQGARHLRLSLEDALTVFGNPDWVSLRLIRMALSLTPNVAKDEWKTKAREELRSLTLTLATMEQICGREDAVRIAREEF